MFSNLFLLVLITSLVTSVVGVFISNLMGCISNTYTSVSLSISDGCMLYIVACDLIPSSKEISKNKIVSLVYIIGILIGLYIIKMK